MTENQSKPFWQSKTLREMNSSEWESLCDGCGKCCLEKLEDEDTGVVYTTAVTCRLLDLKTCACSNYAKRFQYMDDCIKLTPQKIDEINWLPKTCAYLLVKEGKDLPSWHPLKTGDKQSTLKTGNGANKYGVHPVNASQNFIDYILEDDDV